MIDRYTVNYSLISHSVLYNNNTCSRFLLFISHLHKIHTKVYKFKHAGSTKVQKMTSVLCHVWHWALVSTGITNEISENFTFCQCAKWWYLIKYSQSILKVRKTIHSSPRGGGGVYTHSWVHWLSLLTSIQWETCMYTIPLDSIKFTPALKWYLTHYQAGPKYLLSFNLQTVYRATRTINYIVINYLYTLS